MDTKFKCEICGKNDFKNKKSLSNHKRWHSSKMSYNSKGENNPNWSSGKFKRSDGYVFVFCPNHPYAVKNYVMEHRLIMEKKLGRYIKPSEIVHHIDGNNLNNNPDNLQLVSQSKHCKIEGFGSNLKGKKKTKEHIENRRRAVIKSGVYKKNKNPNYRHGYYSGEDNPRLSKEHKEWRVEILKRDKYTCQKCGSKNNLQVDHIKSFALFPELRFELSNGRVLCKECHMKTESYLKATPKKNKKICVL